DAVLLHVARLLIVGGERVPVGDEIQARVFRLQPHPVLQHPVVMAEVQAACRPHAGKDSGLVHRQSTMARISASDTPTSGPSTALSTLVSSSRTSNGRPHGSSFEYCQAARLGSIRSSSRGACRC